MFLTKAEVGAVPIDGLFNAMSGAGAIVNHETALKDPTVKACIRVISQTVSSLPLKLYRQDATVAGSGWVLESDSLMAHTITRKPNMRQTTPEFIEQMVAQVCLFSDYYAIVNKAPRDGKVLSITPFNSSSQVTPIELNNGGVKYQCITNEGASLTLDSSRVLHVRDLAFSTVKAIDKIHAAKSSLGLALAATDNAEAYYRQGSRSGAFIVSDTTLSEDAYTRLYRQFNSNYTGTENAHKIGILEGGMKFVPNPYNIKDAQVLEARNASVREIASMFGVPIPLLGLVDPAIKDTSDINAFFYTSCLQAMLRKIEARLNLILPRGYAVHFDVSEYLRGDIKTQAEVTERLFTRGLISRTEARMRMGMQPDTDKAIYVVNSNNLEFGSLSDLTNPTQKQ